MRRFIDVIFSNTGGPFYKPLAFDVGIQFLASVSIEHSIVHDYYDQYIMGEAKIRIHTS